MEKANDVKRLKLIHLLESLSKRELSSFEKFVSSPYFNSNQKLLELLRALIPFHPSYSSEKLMRTHLYSTLFPNESYSDVKFRKYTSLLLQLLDEFLCSENFKQDEVRKHLTLLKELDRRKKQHLLELQLIQSKEYLIEKDIECASYFRDLSEFEQIHLGNESMKAFTSHKNASNKFIPNPYFHYLDCHNVLEKLRIYGSMLSREIHTDVKLFEESVAEELLRKAQEPEFVNIPIIAIYSNALELRMNSDNDELYYRFKDLVLANHSNVEVNTLLELKSIALNVCKIQIELGKHEYSHEQFDWNMFMVEHDYYRKRGFLFQLEFRNIVVHGLYCGEHEWVHQFIEGHIELVPKEIRQGTLDLCQAFYYHHIKQYDKVLDHLLHIKLKTKVSIIDREHLLIKTYYEQGEFQALSSLLNSSMQRLNRGVGLSDLTQRSLRSFLQYTKRLLLIAESKEIPEINVLRNEVAESRHFAGKQWIERSLEELKESLMPSSYER